MVDKESFARNPFKPEEEKLRFHYNGYRVKDGGKAIEIGVRLPDEQYGRILLPFEEIQSIHKQAWSQIESEAEERMKGKRVHCRHKVSFHAFMPECCQIGLDNGPHDVNCLDCQFIDGYIEDYDPLKEIQTIAVSEKLDV